MWHGCLQEVRSTQTDRRVRKLARFYFIKDLKTLRVLHARLLYAVKRARKSVLRFTIECILYIV